MDPHGQELCGPHQRPEVRGGLNGAVRLNEATVFNDIDADVLTGSVGSDWFLFDSTRDRATDLHDEAFLNDLSFING